MERIQLLEDFALFLAKVFGTMTKAEDTGALFSSMLMIKNVTSTLETGMTIHTTIAN